MYVKPFRYERAGSLGEACDALRAYGGAARAIAGGQSLLPMMNLGILELEAVVDVGHVAGHRGVAPRDGYLDLGSLTRHAELERDPLVRARQPLLADAVRFIGSPRIRGWGTLGGSLAHADPAAELPLVMTVLGAEYALTDGRGRRTVAATDFHLGSFTTSLGEDELIESVAVPALGPGWGWAFVEVARRLGDFALVAAAALARVGDGRVIETRVGLGGASERPLRLGAVEAGAAGAMAEELEDRIGPIEGIDPVTDTSGSAGYRRHLARVLVLRALRDAIGRAGEAG